MKKISKILGFSAKLMFFSVPLLFNQTYANEHVLGCNNLRVNISDYIHEDYLVHPPKIIHGGYDDHGSDNGCLRLAEGTDYCTDYLFKQSEFSYGPDIEISFIDKLTTKTEAIRIQQNYCFLEAGDITVTTPKDGKFKFTYRTVQGSWGSKLPGVVTITSVKSH